LSLEGFKVGVVKSIEKWYPFQIIIFTEEDTDV
jgi:hypothetical protein